MKVINVEVSGIRCNSCVNKITSHLQKIEEVHEVKVNLDHQLVTVTSINSFSNMELRSDLIDLGFSVVSMKKV